MAAQYDPGSLTWNNLHTINEEYTYCYCGKDRNLTEVSLQCLSCLNWFHAKCTKISLDTTIPIFTNYKFTCKWCNNSSCESFKRSQAGWKEIGGCAIANLMLQQHMTEYKAHKGDAIYSSAYAKKLPPFQYYFNKNEHLRPFVDKNWSSLCTERSRTATWWATLGSCLYSTKDLFVAKDENNRSASSNFCLVDPNLWNIRPGHFGTSHSRTPARAHREAVNNSTRAICDSGTPDEASLSAVTHPSSSKRQSTPFRSPSEQSVATNGQTQSSRSNTVIALMEESSSSITEFGQSGEQNNLRHGFKYLPCQADKLFPYIQYRNSELPPYGIRLSKEDASLSVWISGDQLTSTTDFGFSMSRANCPVKEGKWFFEVFVDRGGEGKIDGKDGAHVRVGWARREGNRNSPVGSDAYSYGFRDLTGQKVHQSRPTQYGEPFKTGDVIGLYISLPPLKKVDPSYQPKSPKRHRIPILFKGDTIFEYKDFKPTYQMNQLLELPEKKKEKKYWWQQQQNEKKPAQSQPEIPILPGSKIIVYKNGVCQGVAFENIYSFLPTTDKYTNDDDLTEDDGSLGYYPAVSMYRGGTCTLNFGPHFRYPPPPDPELDPALNKPMPKTPAIKSSLIKTSVVKPLLNKQSSSASSSFSSLNPQKSTGVRNWRPMSERYMEYVTEDVLYDLVDEIELWDWMSSQKNKVISTKRPAIVEMSDGSLKKRKQEGTSRHETNDNEDSKYQGFSVSKWDEPLYH